jgi:hypothetical protein
MDIDQARKRLEAEASSATIISVLLELLDLVATIDDQLAAQHIRILDIEHDIKALKGVPLKRGTRRT